MSYTLLKMYNNITIRSKNTESLRRKDTRRESMSMEKPNPRLRSHLFTIRVWEEEIGTEQTEWRGKVQLFTTGEVRYFRKWAALAPLLLTMLSELDSELESNQ
jgi:hypothetical protein